MTRPTLRIHLFGSFEVVRGEESLTLPTSAKARSLLAYLCIHRATPLPRPALVGTFWPEQPESRARRYLTQALWQIRSNLPEIIAVDTQTVQIHPEAALWVDVEEFGKLVNCENGKLGKQSANQSANLPNYQSTNFPINQSTNLPIHQSTSLPYAIALYRGDLLEGFYDDWVLTERENLREMYLQALDQLIHSHKSAGGYQAALDFALTSCKAGQLRESTHREIMRLHFLLDRPQAAFQQFDTYRQILQAETGREPDPETLALADEIARSSGASPVPHLPKTPRPDTTFTLQGSHPRQFPIVGRKDERAQLLTCVEPIFDASERGGGIVIVEGEAGVGKTRLVQEVARDIEWRGAQVLWGQVSEPGLTPPYGPLALALGSGITPLRAGQLHQLVDLVWLQVLTPLIPELASHLPELHPAPPLESTQEQTRLCEALVRFLKGWAQITPLMLILEDLQWADKDTLGLLPTLARRLEDTGVVIVCTHRSEEVRAFPILWENLQTIDRAGLLGRMTLTRLDETATGTLIRCSLGMSQSAPIFEARLYQETEGNPLFVLETLRALYDEELLQRNESGTWTTPWDESTADYAELPLPPAVEQVINRRLSRLLPDLTHTLRVAAVLGSEFDFALLRAGCDLESSELLSSIQELIRRHFVIETPQAYKFSHDKIRQVAYAEIAEAERTRLHLRVAQAMETHFPERVTALAYHFRQGRAWVPASQYHRAAGSKAASVGAHAVAREHFDQAIALFDQAPLSPDEHFDLLEKYESTLSVLGHRAAQVEIMDEMLRLAEAMDDPARRGRTYSRQGWLEVLAGDPLRAVALLDEAAALARAAGDRQLLANTLVMAARAWWRIGDTPRCQTAIEQAQVFFQETDDRPGESQVLNMLGNLHLGMTGNYAQALACFEAGRRMYRELGDTYREACSLGNIGITCTLLGCYQRSQETLAETLEAMTRSGDRNWQGIIRLWQGVNHHGLGDLKQAQTLAQEALNICREVGDSNFEIAALELLGQIALARNEPGEACLLFQQSVEVAQANQQTMDWAIQQSHLALAYLHLGNITEADRLSKQAVTTLENLEEWVCHIKDVYFERYQILAATDRPETAAHHLERAYQHLMKMADDIRDTGLRRSFLEAVPDNRAIVNARRLGYPESPVQQQMYRLPRANVPTGRPLRDDEWVEVKWTVAALEDDAIPGKANRRRARLLRMLGEAESQGAAPTVDALAQALDFSERTIKRDLAALREAGHAVHTRGSRG